MRLWQTIGLSAWLGMAPVGFANAQGMVEQNDCRALVNQNPATLAFLRLKQLKTREVVDEEGLKIGSISIPAVETSSESVGNGGDPVGYTRLLVDFTPCDAK